MQKVDYEIQYAKTIKESLEYKQSPKEKNFFSIGARGHYENPISDIMAFFMHPREEHGFQTLFLQSLAKCLSINIDVLSFLSIEREVVTDEGNRIDILIEGEDWVIVIENKIYHQVLNPLDEYIEFINNTYQNKSCYFILLSLEKKMINHDNWMSLSYVHFINEIEKGLGKYLLKCGTTKWVVFLREYVVNIKALIGEETMDQKMLSFIQNNYAQINEIIKMRSQYLNYISKEIQAIMQELGHEKVTHKIYEGWGEKKVGIKFSSKERWGPKTNIVFVVREDGEFEVDYYIYGIEEEEWDALDQHFLNEKYDAWIEGDTICAYGLKEEYSSLTLGQGLQEFKSVLQLMDGFYKNK
ncbi:PD-(D/E)XK nuclease family protein [Bacillus sp. WLY-B-L8]|uniref:PD-(D/E)XK nuclease family protein n=1 Tax=Bacillus multifaciens TaxID=3068506 RepID=UPI0027404381|nr:PD-(D/E)XK nuclease family protein [Bacillus sp. WLY-B-L8]MDP7980688.1 PD-(D/E)XK nuclease family protein [Bacillus sp. WLY-B-L8]